MEIGAYTTKVHMPVKKKKVIKTAWKMYFISTACVFNFKHLRFSYLFFNFFFT